MAAPFDTMNARDELWSDLCQIRGVTLDKRLTGQPSFPLQKLLHILNSREQFQQVFSNVIDKTLQGNAD